jgi:hypothetical protein
MADQTIFVKKTKRGQELYASDSKSERKVLN